MGIWTSSVADQRGPVGPFLLEVLLTNPVAPHQREWRFQQSVKDLDEGLRVAARMCQTYEYRLFLEPGHYVYLDWQDDPTNAHLCNAAWVTERPSRT